MANVGIGEEQGQVLSLVPNVVPLKSEVGTKKVQNIRILNADCCGRPLEAVDVADGSHGSMDGGVAETDILTIELHDVESFLSAILAERIRLLVLLHLLNAHD